MHALFLVTYTEDCEKNWRSWNCIGNTCHVEQYDNRPHDRHGELVTLAQTMKPDVIIYVGAIEKYHNRPVPSTDILKRLRDVAPSVHICGDASDKPWWEWLYRYTKEECFNVQVSIDGSFNTPLATSDDGLIKLTPTDPSHFTQTPWEQRQLFVGMSGGLGHGERLLLVQRLLYGAGLQWRKNLPFGEMARFMGSCKMIVNSPMNGTGDSVHVKGRVLETAWAGACLLERSNPCTSNWFGDDLYVPYSDAEDAVRKIAWAKGNDAEISDKAKRFNEFVTQRHHPRVFWNDVLEKAGVKQ